MSMRIVTAVVVLPFVLAASPDVAQARNVLEWAGDKLATGAIPKLEPALARTLSDVDGRLAKHEDRIGNLVDGLVANTGKALDQRLDRVDGILEKRLMQVQLGVDGVLDHGLDKIDGAARARLLQLDGIAAGRIKQVQKGVAESLEQVDGILKNNIGEVGRVVTGALNQADDVLEERLDQVDEIAGRRLGNVDVMASKQRLGLERTITRSAWLIGLVVFVVMLLRALWKEYAKRDEDAFEALRPGSERAKGYAELFAMPLLRHAAVGAVVAALLAVVPERLPMAAAREQQALVDKHARELERSFAALDWTRVRFHASQLEVLQPEDVLRYRVMEAKADLLRDVLEKETSLATPAGLAMTLRKVQAIERLQPGRAEPDATTVRAMILWQRGSTKAEEHEAASLAARALWSAPRGFTLAPMARLLVQAYLRAPDPAAPTADTPGLESTASLTAAIAMSMPPAAGSPFEGVSTLFDLMQRLEQKSSAAFVEMVAAQAEVARLAKKARNKLGANPATAARNAAAEKIVRAWSEFDDALRETPVLVANPEVLGIFKLDDVMLTHALWFTTQPGTTEWPQRLSAIKDSRLKLAVAPARAVWARRYMGLLQGPARELIELQEAQRFEALEEDAIAFETNYGRLESIEVSGEERDEQRLVRVEAARAAASLSLYEDEGPARVSLAVKLAGGLAGLQTKAHEALEGVQSDADLALSKKATSAKAKLHQEIEEAKRKLRAELTGRQERLI
jgi:hypothetical protein